MTCRNRLLIIGGEGRKSGKSSLAELIISRFAAREITAVKITPHPHPDMTGMEEVTVTNRYSIFEEKCTEKDKDTSRMLRAGAAKAYLVVASDNDLAVAFETLEASLSPLTPLVCESPALRRFVNPGLFVIMRYTDNNHSEKKNIDNLIPLADLSLTYNDISEGKADNIDLEKDNKWYIKP